MNGISPSLCLILSLLASHLANASHYGSFMLCDLGRSRSATLSHIKDNLISTSMAPNKLQVGLIIREREPVNLEYPFDQLDEFLKPNDLFYIRSHFNAPVLDRPDYKLTIGGAVKNRFTISYEELLAMPSVTRPATLECAGNGRIFLVPQVKVRSGSLGQ